MKQTHAQVKRTSGGSASACAEMNVPSAACMYVRWPLRATRDISTKLVLGSTRVFKGVYTPLLKLVGMINAVSESCNAGKQPARGSDEHKKPWREKGGLLLY